MGRALAKLLRENRFGRYAFFLDKSIDLCGSVNMWECTAEIVMALTRSNAFSAFSLTNGLAITGIFCEAGMWPAWLLRRYGTDMIA